MASQNLSDLRVVYKIFKCDIIFKLHINIRSSYSLYLDIMINVLGVSLHLSTNQGLLKSSADEISNIRFMPMERGSRAENREHDLPSDSEAL